MATQTMTATQTLASHMQAWQYNKSSGGIQKNMFINPSTPMPTPNQHQHLVQIIACALNPIDHKPSEIFLIDKFLNTKPATPGIDFAGRIVKPAPGSGYQAGQLVFGCAGDEVPIAGGGLAEYALVLKDHLAAIPKGLNPIDAATVGVAGLTAVQAIGTATKPGQKIFVNGGSGGTGVFTIQIAKQKGLFVTTTCSTPNVAFCKSLGADEVIDYKKGSVLEALKASGHKFDRVIDNIGTDLSLYWKCHEYTKPGAGYVLVGATPNFKALTNNTKIKLWPGFLGGGRRTKESFLAKPNEKDLTEIGRLMAQGKVKTAIDTKFPFEQAVQAFEKLRTGRARGKVVVDVAS